MGKTILSVNAGSSSVKITFYTLDKLPREIANASVSRLTAPPSTFKYNHGGVKHKETLDFEIRSPPHAFSFLLDRFIKDPNFSEIASTDDLQYICHRVVHGGNYDHAIIITQETYHYLKTLEELAPLHNFAALEIIRVCRQELPKIKSVTYFDTTFHHTLPEHIKTYPLNPEVCRAKNLKKYGFHGISYSFIQRTVATFLKKPSEKLNIIAMHVGSGASICAIKDGKSVDTSMGLTPLAGLPGATRSGSVDPSMIFHLTDEPGKMVYTSGNDRKITQAEAILNKESGWKVLTGTTDFSEIGTDKPASANHKLAFDIFVDRILGYIGSYFLKLGGQVDALVFAGGVGENSWLLRKALVENSRSLGFAVDESANTNGPIKGQSVTDISREPEKTPRVLICQTDEQFEMAYRCVSTLHREEEGKK